MKQRCKNYLFYILEISLNESKKDYLKIILFFKLNNNISNSQNICYKYTACGTGKV